MSLCFLLAWHLFHFEDICKLLKKSLNIPQKIEKTFKLKKSKKRKNITTNVVFLIGKIMPNIFILPSFRIWKISQVNFFCYKYIFFHFKTSEKKLKKVLSPQKKQKQFLSYIFLEFKKKL